MKLKSSFLKYLVVLWNISSVLTECEKLDCTRKCCPWGMGLLLQANEYTCKNYSAPFEFENVTNYVISRKCPPTTYPVSLETTEFTISTNGLIHLKFGNDSLDSRPNKYCINFGSDKTGINLIFCAKKEESSSWNFIGEFLFYLYSSMFIIFFLRKI